jgi:XTP/dITP diphosphohydrolase
LPPKQPGDTLPDMAGFPTILLATGNPHKVEELSAHFDSVGLSVIGLGDLDMDIEPPVEDQSTFIGNARLKARYYAQRTGRLCLADDSGIEVDALGGRPGVHSARFAGVQGDRAHIDAANNARLLSLLRGVPEPQRTARFVCVMVLADNGQILAESRGTVEGRILENPRGENGFGYDPVFFVSETGCTAAELTAQQKNAISHRGHAARQMLDQIRRLPAMP